MNKPRSASVRAEEEEKKKREEEEGIVRLLASIWKNEGFPDYHSGDTLSSGALHLRVQMLVIISYPYQATEHLYENSTW